MTPVVHQLPYPSQARQLSGSRFAAAAGVVGAICIVMAMQPGTGGLSTVAYYKARGSQGYPFAGYQGPSAEQDAPCIDGTRTPAEDLVHVRAFLRPTMSDLADAFGVSRQALYDWQAGKPIAAENAARLADLGRAADVLAAEGLTASAQLVRRPVSAGRTLLDIVRSGGSAEEAANVLAGIVKREWQQREALAVRLTGRKRPRAPSDDLGTPVLSEAG